jgi:hypothetical protein
MNNANEMSDEWLQMNFPVGSGPEIIAGGDCFASPHHYMKIEFPKNSDSAFFAVYETPEENNGLRSNKDEPVIALSLSRELLLKIVRTIKVSNDFILSDDMREW